MEKGSSGGRSNREETIPPAEESRKGNERVTKPAGQGKKDQDDFGSREEEVMGDSGSKVCTVQNSSPMLKIKRFKQELDSIRWHLPKSLDHLDELAQEASESLAVSNTNSPSCWIIVTSTAPGLTALRNLSMALEGGIERLRSNPLANHFLNRQAVTMPAYNEVLSEGELDALVDYTEWLRGESTGE